MLKNKIGLIVSGSIAAVKTFSLIESLKRRGFSPQLWITEAGASLLSMPSKHTPALHHLKKMISSAYTTPDFLQNEDLKAILVAPASADILSQIVYKNTALGEIFIQNQKPLVLAPAMNPWMWSHPAVQENVKTLCQKGVHIIGPDNGSAACGDNGCGRMVEPDHIVSMLKRIVEDSLSCTLYEDIKPASIPLLADHTIEKILLINASPAFLLSQGFKVQCALPPQRRQDSSQLYALTKFPVISDHYQIYSKEGMEHIWLGEDADVMVVHTDAKYAQKLAYGSAEDFIGCLYLASKRPVIIIADDDCSPSDISMLIKHGALLSKPEELVSTLNALPRSSTPRFAGKTCLILGGSPQEKVDSFRFYENTKRDKDHGKKLTETLRAKGATVIFLEPSQENAKEFLENIRRLSSQNFDVVVQLANISQFTCADPAPYKISKSGEEKEKLFNVEGNIDFISALQNIWGSDIVMGYDNYQEWHGGKMDIPLHRYIQEMQEHIK